MTGVALLPQAQRLSAVDLAARLARQEKLAAARQTARGLVAEARRQAAEILAEAQRAAEASREETLSEVAKTRTTLLARARREARALRLREAAEAAGRLTEKFDALTPWLGRFVYDCVARILGEMEPSDVARAILAEALARARSDWTVRLHCHPDSAEALRAIVTGRNGPDGPFRAVTEVADDPRLAPGECLLESETGFVEIGIEAQLDALRLALDAGAMQDEGNPHAEAAEDEASAEEEYSDEEDYTEEDHTGEADFSDDGENAGTEAEE